MTTLAIMKARIASELRRSDLTTQIAAAIDTAIDAYEHERWFFNESRENTFSTVALQQSYGVADAAFIGLISKIDYVFIVINTEPFALLPKPMIEVDDFSASTFVGQPGDYAWYDEKIFLYPTPPEAYTIRVGAVIEQAAPASDSETGNPWMTTAERLIRSRAKYELYTHVLRNVEEASVMAAAVTEAHEQLSIRTTRKVKTGGGRVKAMNF